MREKYGWHWLPRSMKLGYSDGRRVIPGRWIEMDGWGLPTLCIQGMHASERIVDAMAYHIGPILCRVIVRGDLQQLHDDNKFVGRERKVLWHREMPTAELRRIVRRCYIDIGIEPRGLGQASRWELSARLRHLRFEHFSRRCWRERGSWTSSWEKKEERMGMLAELALRRWAREHGCPPRR